ncbi:hypothetical protein CKA38_11040 [Ereboglobus luteus]|uniref:Uncharacterized protein n=1 Tax=Ereboglobus luteus TaxID=1796921 RepID=A0A2U8E476_9BACT|nr:hypothetical protein CKA38_11040 [Ereboglobus luteus]
MGDSGPRICKCPGSASLFLVNIDPIVGPPRAALRKCAAPDGTLEELKAALGVKCTPQAINWVLKKMGLTYRKDVADKHIERAKGINKTAGGTYRELIITDFCITQTGPLQAKRLNLVFFSNSPELFSNQVGLGLTHCFKIS